MQAAFGMDKKAVVAEFVKPSPAEKDAFWKLYDEYEVKRKELGKQRIELLLSLIHICTPEPFTGHPGSKRSGGL